VILTLPGVILTLFVICCPNGVVIGECTILLLLVTASDGGFDPNIKGAVLTALASCRGVVTSTGAGEREGPVTVGSMMGGLMKDPL
jgi:hypothetical protein